jgi:hypothetical protein
MGAFTRGVLLAATTAGCMLNGKALGDPPRKTAPTRDATPTSPSPPSQTPTPTPAPSGEVEVSYEEVKRPPLPYPNSPADPWAAVVGDQPRRMTKKEAYLWKVRRDELACTGARDHCFAADTWMIEWDELREKTNRSAYALGFGIYENVGMQEAGLATPDQASGGVRTAAPSVYKRKEFTAYRTVPAAKKNLVPGALIVALPFPRKHPDSGLEVFESTWVLGVVDRVDRETGFVFLVGNKDPLWISTARVAVLSWRPGGKVTILGGAKRDQLAVSVSEVILP